LVPKPDVVMAEPDHAEEVVEKETPTETVAEAVAVPLHRVRLPVPEDRHNDQKADQEDPFSFETSHVVA